MRIPQSTIDQMGKDLLNEFTTDLGLELSRESHIQVMDGAIYLGIMTENHGREILDLQSTLLIRRSSVQVGGLVMSTVDGGPEILPFLEAHKWRAIHAAELVKVWEQVQYSIEETLKKFDELFEDSDTPDYR